MIIIFTLLALAIAALGWGAWKFVSADPKQAGERTRLLFAIALILVALFFVARVQFQIAAPIALIALGLVGRKAPFGLGWFHRDDPDDPDEDGGGTPGADDGADDGAGVGGRADGAGSDTRRDGFDRSRSERTTSGGSDGESAYARRRARGPLTEKEALDILGLREGASAEDIVLAHRRLIKQLHPDSGGSAYLSAQINAAKDMLLEKARSRA